MPNKVAPKITHPARPMYPIASNGASVRIADAPSWREPTRGRTPEALQAYEAGRRRATFRIVLANRANGPEQVMQMVEQRAPDGFTRIEYVLTRWNWKKSRLDKSRSPGWSVTH